MSSALRELLLAIKVRVDKTAVKETDTAFDHATKSASEFEARVNSATTAVGKLAEKLGLVNSLARKLSDAQALGMKSHPAPPRPGGPNMAAPDINAFMVQPDTRSAPQKALDALKAKAQSAMSAAGAAVQRFNDRFDGTIRAIGSARTALVGFAAVMVGTAVARFFGQIVETGGALHDMAQRTRVSVETLQVWNAIAADAGADAGAVESAFRKLSRAMAGAARGGKLQATSFKELGVEYKNADGSLRSTEEVLIDTGAALANLDDDAKATAIATQLLGPAGAALVPAFRDGADAVRKLSAELKENVSLNAQEAARLDDVGDALTRGTKKWAAMKLRIGVAMLPVLEAVSGAFEKVSKWMLRMTRETKVLQTIFLTLTGAGLARMVTMFGAWIARVGGARAAMALLGQGLRTAAAAAARFLLPILAIEDFLVFLAGGKSLFGRAFEEIFGAGGAKRARQEILDFFKKTDNFIQNEIAPALREIKPIFEGIGTIVGSTILGALNLVGMALSDDEKKTMALAQAFERNMAPAVSRVASMIQALGRSALKMGLTDIGLGLTGEGDELKKMSAEMANSGRNVGQANGSQNFSQFIGSHNAQVAMARLDATRANLKQSAAGVADTYPAAMHPAAPPQPIMLNDQRTTNINVGGANAPAATGRAVADAVGVELTKDRRQTLMAVSG